MKKLISRSVLCGTVLLVAAAAALAQTPARALPQVHRVYVAPLAGGAAADSMREMLIAALSQTGVFVLTDDETKADAILKGAADDRTYVDTFDSDRSISTHEDAGVGSGSRGGKNGGLYGGASGADREAYRIRDRKHEAYAAVRLINRAGDTLWSTTQESQGAKFRSASTDVANKVARQILLDLSRPQAR